MLKKLDLSAGELLDLEEPPRAIDYEVIGALRRKDIALLAFKKYLDLQKYIAYKNLREAYLNEKIESDYEKHQLLQ